MVKIGKEQHDAKSLVGELKTHYKKLEEYNFGKRPPSATLGSEALDEIKYIDKLVELYLSLPQSSRESVEKGFFGFNFRKYVANYEKAKGRIVPYAKEEQTSKQEELEKIPEQQPGNEDKEQQYLEGIERCIEKDGSAHDFYIATFDGKAVPYDDSQKILKEFALKAGKLVIVKNPEGSEYPFKSFSYADFDAYLKEHPRKQEQITTGLEAEVGEASKENAPARNIVDIVRAEIERRGMANIPFCRVKIGDGKVISITPIDPLNLQKEQQDLPHGVYMACKPIEGGRHRVVDSIGAARGYAGPYINKQESEGEKKEAGVTPEGVDKTPSKFKINYTKNNEPGEEECVSFEDFKNVLKRIKQEGGTNIKLSVAETEGWTPTNYFTIETQHVTKKPEEGKDKKQ